MQRTAHTDASEDLRRIALEALHVLDTHPEQGFDDIVRLAGRLCETPVALVSLVTADRQWFKAKTGLALSETDLDRSVCRFALAEPDLLIIPDLSADPRTANNPLVTGEPRIRFYAGAPLRLPDGHVVGSLCVIDMAPRPQGLTAEQADDLRALGRQVATLLTVRRDDERLRQADERLQMALAASGVVGLWDWMVDTDLLHGDASFARLYGLDADRTRAGLTEAEYQEHVVPEDLVPLRARIRDVFERGADFLVEYRLAIPGEALRWVECKGRMILDQAGRPFRFSGTAVDVTARRRAEEDLRVLNDNWNSGWPSAPTS